MTVVALDPPSLRGALRLHEPMRRHTTFRIGGPATAWVEPADLDDLRRVAEWSRRASLPIFLTGEGSNLLVLDGGLDAIVVSLGGSAFRQWSLEEDRLRVGCGMTLGGLLRTTCQLGLSGCEFLSGIPGTVGGSLVMNAGGGRMAPSARGGTSAASAPDAGRLETSRPVRHIGELVESVMLMTVDGDLQRLDRDRLQFAYRSSNLRSGVLLETLLRLERQDQAIVQHRVQQYFQHKRSTQELGRPSAGCIFKNSAGVPAGRLIEASGLKGRRVGGAAVSSVHANFIINDGEATAADVLALVEMVRETVARDHGVQLELELIVVGKAST